MPEQKKQHPPEPPFIPREGQIDYTNIKRAPVINSVVVCQGKILLVQRNPNMKFHPGVWSGISGFLDEPHKSVEEKVREELREELGIQEDEIVSIREGELMEEESPEYDKVWIVHPVLVELSTFEENLDWEAQNFVWVEPEEARQYDLLPNFDKVLDAFSL